MKSFYLIFIIAALLDFLMPSLTTASWVPRFTLAVLSFLFLFPSGKASVAIAAAASLFFWLVSGVNLGIAVFTFGLMLFLERWLLLRIFHRDAWQTLVAAAGGLVAFGIFLAGLTELLTPENSLFQISFILTIGTSAVLAVGINFFLRTIIYRKGHEKTA